MYNNTSLFLGHQISNTMLCVSHCIFFRTFRTCHLAYLGSIQKKSSHPSLRWYNSDENKDDNSDVNSEFADEQINENSGQLLKDDKIFQPIQKLKLQVFPYFVA